jgi:uncharacterized protein YjbI with pentapeptide repeats
VADAPQRPSTDDRATWKAYWAALGMPWRTEPDIGVERQRFLTERRGVAPNVELGIYPFRDEHGSVKLARADVEWLLATHESAGVRGPVEWRDPRQLMRQGLDLRGADLQRQDLSDLPLARLQGGIPREEWFASTALQREAAAVHLEDATLRGTSLEDASLRAAHMERAYLREARLAGAELVSAHLEGASFFNASLKGEAGSDALLRDKGDRVVILPPTDLHQAFFDQASSLSNAILGDRQLGGIRVADVRWNGVNLGRAGWQDIAILRDEFVAREPRASTGRAKDAARRLDEYRTMVRAYRQLSITLREQGISEDADRFAYRAQYLERGVLRRQRQWVRALGSWLLDGLAGYGYKPLRSVFTYVLVIATFTLIYLTLGGAHGQVLSWNEALVVSMTAFHGRGFFGSAFQPGDPQAAVAAIEALIGLLIEITFIATFTQRFFAR